MTETSSLDVTAGAVETSTLAPDEYTPAAFTVYETLALVTVENANVDDGSGTAHVYSDEVAQLTPDEVVTLDADTTINETPTFIAEEALIEPIDSQIDEEATVVFDEEQLAEVDISERASLLTSETKSTAYFVSPTARLSATFICVETARTDQNSVVHVCVDEIIDLGIIKEVALLPATIIKPEPANTLLTTETSVPNARISETATLTAVDSTILGAVNVVINEPAKIKPVEIQLIEVELEADELGLLVPFEQTTAAKFNTRVITAQEIINLVTSETRAMMLPMTAAETLTLKVISNSDPNFVPQIAAYEPPTDYTLEVRKRNGATYDLMGVLENRIAPSLSREIGLADVLTFNMQLSDPKSALVLQNPAGIEIWYWGRDKILKQVFTLAKVEPYRDYGGSAGSGGATLGSGSGDNVLVTCDGLESYLTMYHIRNDYKVVQRHVQDILTDICYEAVADHIIHSIYVDPSLNIVIDIDLSWENLKTACDNILKQTGGYMHMWVDGNNPNFRVLGFQPLATNVMPATLIGASSYGLAARRFSEPVAASTVLPVLVFDAFPDKYNTIRNNGGTGGSDYEGAAHMNDYVQLQNGASAWAFNDTYDYIVVPTGLAIADLRDMTIEFEGYIGTQELDEVVLWSKAQEYGAFELIYDSVNERLKLTRGTTDENLDVWVSTVGSVPSNDWYLIQLIWESGKAPDPDNTPPTIFLDKALLELTNTSPGTGYYWMNDFSNDLYIGNRATFDAAFIGIMSLFRVYRATLDDPSTNFIQDGWRRDPAPAQVVFSQFPVNAVMVESSQAGDYATNIIESQAVDHIPSIAESNQVVEGD